MGKDKKRKIQENESFCNDTEKKKSKKEKKEKEFVHLKEEDSTTESKSKAHNVKKKKSKKEKKRKDSNDLVKNGENTAILDTMQNSLIEGHGNKMKLDNVDNTSDNEGPDMCKEITEKDGKVKKTKKPKKEKSNKEEDKMPESDKSLEKEDTNMTTETQETEEGKVKKKKKDKKKKVKQEKSSTDEGSETVSTRDLALDYLKTWHSSREKWNFQKVRQVWILKHMYDTEKLPDDEFRILLEYMENSKGKARESTVRQAEDLIEKYEDADNTTVTEEGYMRAREVLQMLS